MKGVEFWYLVGQVERFYRTRKGKIICRWVGGYSTKPDGSRMPWVTKPEARLMSNHADLKAKFAKGEGA